MTITNPETVSDLPVWRRSYAWANEDEAIHEICDQEGDIRELRFAQWDRCSAFHAAYGYGAVERLARALGVVPRTINNYVAAGRTIPPYLRVRDLSTTVYYRASRDERALAELEYIVRIGGSEADFWKAIAAAPNQKDDVESWEAAGEWDVASPSAWQTVRALVEAALQEGKRVRVKLEVLK